MEGFAKVSKHAVFVMLYNGALTVKLCMLKKNSNFLLHLATNHLMFTFKFKI